MPNAVFSFGEATAWVSLTGGGSFSIGFIRSYSFERTPVLVEDGSAALYKDRLSFESPWVDDDVTQLFYAKGPVAEIGIQWTNADDSRVESCVLTNARITEARRAPGEGMIEVFSFTLESISLPT